MHEPATALHTVDLASLGERLSALRLCDAASLTAVRRSLEQHGQLTALTVFGSRDQLEVLDGFKRARAARALGWPTLLARVDAVASVEAKLRLCTLHDRRGLTALEEGWLVRSLYVLLQIRPPSVAMSGNSWSGCTPEVRSLRDAIEHMDEDISREALDNGQPRMLAVNREGTHLEIGSEGISFLRLAEALREIHALGLSILAVEP